MAIITRTNKGSALTWVELDGNFTELETNIETNANNISSLQDSVNELSNTNNIAITQTISELESLSGNDNIVSFLSQSGREGEFIYNSGDYSAETTADTNKGIYIPAIGGAWIRKHLDGVIYPSWFGNTATALEDNLQPAIDYLSNSTFGKQGGIIQLPRGNFELSTQKNIDESGITIRGIGADNERSAWGNWPTQILWTGSANSTMFMIDNANTGLLSGITLEDMVLIGDGSEDSILVNTSNNVRKSTIRNVIMRITGTGLYLNTSCFGWELDKVTFFNMFKRGAELYGANHHTTFNNCTAQNVGNTEPVSEVVRIGYGDRCSYVAFNDCDFEHGYVQSQINAIDVRSLRWTGYMEAPTNLETFFKLGGYNEANTLSDVEGFKCEGWFQGGNRTNYAFDIKNAKGLNFSGSSFAGIETSIVNNPDQNVERSSIGNISVGNNSGGPIQTFRLPSHVAGFCETEPQEVKMFDSSAFKVPIRRNFCTVDLTIFSGGSVLAGSFAVEVVGATSSVTKITSGFSQLVAHGSTQELDGTTGANNSFTIAGDANNYVHFENQLGGQAQVILKLNQPQGEDL